MSEENIYGDNNVSITTARVIISGTNYTLRNITSVRMTTTPASSGCAVVLIVLGALTLLAALITFGHDASGGFVTLIFACGFLAAGIFWLRSLKPSFHVTIASSSGEGRALTSTDRAYIDKIVSSINEAIVRYR